jgi:hypothetical protein
MKSKKDRLRIYESAIIDAERYLIERDRLQDMLLNPWTNGRYALAAVVSGLIIMVVWSLSI